MHLALLGDPTLRLHPVRPPSGVMAAAGPGGVCLRWDSCAETNLAGYNIYQADSLGGEFTRINGGTPIPANAFVDPSGTEQYIYMVRVFKLEISASGTYFNSSQGAFIKPAQGSGPVELGLRIVARSREGVTIGVTGENGREIVLEETPDLAAWPPLATNRLSGVVWEISEPNPAQFHQRFYRVRLIP